MDLSTRKRFLSDKPQLLNRDINNASTSHYAARSGTDLLPPLPSRRLVDHTEPIRSSCPWSRHKIEDKHGVTRRCFFVASSFVSTKAKVLFMGGWTPPSTFSNSGHHYHNGNVYEINDKEPFSIIGISKTHPGQRNDANEPSGRSGHAGLLVGNAFIIYGGATVERRFDDTLYLLNIDTLAWSKVIPQNPPTQRHGHTLQLIGTKLYLYGGVRGEVIFDDLYSFDLNHIHIHGRFAWVSLRPGSALGGPMPSRRAYHTAACYNNEMYLFGGTNGVEVFNDVWVYSASLNNWSELSVIGDIPQPRQGHTSAMIDGVLYIFGGSNEPGETLAELAALRIEERRWYTFANADMGPSPSPRWGHTMTVSSKRIVLLGGTTRTSSSLDAMDNSVYILDTSKVSLNHPTQFAADGKMTDTSMIHDIPKVAGTVPAGKDLDFTMVRRHSTWTMATEITKVTQCHKVSTNLELDIYFAKPNQHNFTSREAKLDTQADGNFISETLVEYLGYEIRPYRGPGFNTAGGIVKPCGETSIFFEWQQSKKLRKKKFLVLEDLPCDLLLGINFINEFEVYKLNGSILVLALAPMSSEQKQEFRDHAKAQQIQGEADERAEEEAFRAKREEARRKRQETERQRRQSEEETNR